MGTERGKAVRSLHSFARKAEFTDILQIFYLRPASTLACHIEAAVKSIGLKIKAESIEDFDPKFFDDVTPEDDALRKLQLFSESLLLPSAKTPPSLTLRW